MQETWVRSLAWEDPLEKGMATQSSTLAWKIPGTEEPGRLQFMGSQRVGQDWATSLSLLTFMHWRRKWQPTPVFLPGEARGRGAWWAAVYGVAQSRTWLKWLSSSSSSSSFLHKWFYNFLKVWKILWPFFIQIFCSILFSFGTLVTC